MTERPFKREEYFAFKYLIAINAASDMILQQLKGRLKDCGRLKSEVKRTANSADKLIDALLRTIPRNQRAMLQKELEHTEFYVRTNNFSAFDNDTQDYVCISRAHMKEALAYIMQSQCEMCEKTGKEAKRCKVSKCLRNLFPYFTPETMPDGTCYYNLYQVNYSDDPLERLAEYDEEGGAE